MPAARTATRSSPSPGSGSSWARHSRWPSATVTACKRASAALADGHVLARGHADVQLARPRDSRVLLEQLLPVRQPTRRARNGEQHREHVDREAHRLVDETRIEVDVRVELAADEVLVGERDLFELERDVEERVLARDRE